MNKLLIGDIPCTIESAFLEPFFDDSEGTLDDHRVVWGLQIRATGGGEYDWRPRFLSERVLETKPNEVSSWRGLVNREGCWGHDEEDEERATLYTFSHEPVIDVRWRFALASSGRLKVVLNGSSHFDHPGGYAGWLPISLESELDHAPIPNGPRSERGVRQRLKRYGLEDPFEFRVVKGVSWLYPTDYPAT